MQINCKVDILPLFSTLCHIQLFQRLNWGRIDDPWNWKAWVKSMILPCVVFELVNCPTRWSLSFIFYMTLPCLVLIKRRQKVTKKCVKTDSALKYHSIVGWWVTVAIKIDIWVKGLYDCSLLCSIEQGAALTIAAIKVYIWVRGILCGIERKAAESIIFKWEELSEGQHIIVWYWARGSGAENWVGKQLPFNITALSERVALFSSILEITKQILEV